MSSADGLSESDLIFLQAQWSEVIEGSVWKWYEVCTVSVSDLSLHPFLYEGTAVPFNYIRQIDTSGSLNVLLPTFLLKMTDSISFHSRNEKVGKY